MLLLKKDSPERTINDCDEITMLQTFNLLQCFSIDKCGVHGAQICQNELKQGEIKRNLLKFLATVDF